MKKSLVMLSVLVLIALLALSFTEARGGSTGGTTNRTTNNPALNAVTAAACETRTELKERIACRMRANANVNSIEESCRALSFDKQAACNTFQNNARPCYDKSPREKMLCLREHVGFGQGQLNRYAPEDRRKYAALLLYELQERVEKSKEQGRLTEDQAADLIASIVHIKQSLLTNASIDTIKEQMVAFKVKWRAAMGASA